MEARLSQRHGGTADNQTLIVAESYAKRLTAYEITDDGSLTNRRVWAEVDHGVPDGICNDAKRPSGTPTCRTSLRPRT